MLTTRRNFGLAALMATGMALSDLAAAHPGPAHSHVELLSAVLAAGLLAGAAITLLLRRRRSAQSHLRRRRND